MDQTMKTLSDVKHGGRYFRQADGAIVPCPAEAAEKAAALEAAAREAAEHEADGPAGAAVGAATGGTPPAPEAA